MELRKYFCDLYLSDVWNEVYVLAIAYVESSDLLYSREVPLHVSYYKNKFVKRHM